MQLIVSGLKKAARDSWGDWMSLAAFNLFCFLALTPALIFLTATIANISMWTVGITAVLFLPFCFLLFSLYEVAYRLNQGDAVKFIQFFQFIRETWLHALIWGLVNILVLMILVGNLVFYSQFVTTWAGIVQFIMFAVFVVWGVLQLFMLPMYPRLQAPGFKNALRNAMAIVGSYAGSSLVVVILTVILAIATIFFQFLAFFFTFFAIAMLGSSMLSVLLDVELSSSEEPPK